MGLVWIPWWLSSKESAYNAGNAGSIPGLGRPPGGGRGNRIQYSCLENPMDRGACQATVPGITKSWDTSEAAEHAHMWKKKKRILTSISQHIQNELKCIIDLL